MKKEQWTDKLRERMAEYEEPAPEGLWDDIESALQQPAVHRRARTVALRRWAAAAVVALLLGGAGVVYFSGSESAVSMTSDSASDEKNLAEEPQSVSEESRRGSVVTDLRGHENSNDMGKAAKQSYLATSPRRSSLKQSATVSQPSKTVNPPASTPLLTLRGNEGSEEQGQGHGDGHAENVEQGHQAISFSHPPVSQKDTLTPTAGGRPLPTPTPVSPNISPSHPLWRTSEPRLSVGLLASNLWAGNMGGSTSAQPVGMAMAAPATFFNESNDDFIKNIGANFKSFNGIASSFGGYYGFDKANSSNYLMALPEYDEKVSHSMPFTVGVSVHYSLSEHWAVISGLVYSRLASEFTRHIGNTVLTDKQTLHYVGLPLKASYRLWGNRQLATYVQAGAQLDVNVSARLNSEGLERNIKKDRLQWSLLGNVGIEYHFLPGLGIYLEPGLHYYFNNGSSVENIFKDTPLNYDLQFGFRLHLK